MPLQAVAVLAVGGSPRQVVVGVRAGRCPSRPRACRCRCRRPASRCRGRRRATSLPSVCTRSSCGAGRCRSARTRRSPATVARPSSASKLRKYWFGNGETLGSVQAWPLFENAGSSTRAVGVEQDRAARVVLVVEQELAEPRLRCGGSTSHGFVSAPKWSMSPGFHGWYQSVSDEADRAVVAAAGSALHAAGVELHVGRRQRLARRTIASSPEPPCRKSSSQPPKMTSSELFAS